MMHLPFPTKQKEPLETDGVGLTQNPEEHHHVLSD